MVPLSVLIKAILVNYLLIFPAVDYSFQNQNSSLPYGTVVRSGAGSFFPVVKIIEKPEKMTILRKQEGWVEIKIVNGKSGWISENVLRRDKVESDYLKRLKESKEGVKVTQAVIVSAVKGFGDRYREAMVEGNDDILAFDRQIITPQMWYDFVKRHFGSKGEKRWSGDRKLKRFTKPVDAGFLERELGLYIAASLVRGKLIRDRKIEAYLSLIATALVRQSEAPNLSVRVYLFHSVKPAAYATPNGMIFISDELWKMIKNEAELAGLLGHEVAHIVHRHAAMELEKRKTEISAERAFAEVKRLTGLSPMEKQIESLALAIYDVVNRGYIEKYEQDADRMGSIYAYRAGWVATEYKNLVERLSKHPALEKDFFDTEFSLSDPFKERLNELTNLRSKLNKRKGRIVNSNEFKRFR